MKRVLFLLLCSAAPAFGQQQRPIIDMHFHVLHYTDHSVVGAAEEAMRRLNVVTALTSGPSREVRELAQRVPDRVIASSPIFPIDPEDFATPKMKARREWPDVEALRAAHKAGTMKAIGEITAQYEGLAPDDPALEPYFALAEELDVPVHAPSFTST